MGIWWWSGWWFGTWILWLSIYWECHHPNWRTHIFQRGRYTTNQSWLASGKRTFAVCELENCLWPLKLWQSVKLPEGNDVDDSKNKGVFFLSKFEENRIRIHKLGMSINQPVLQGGRHRGLEQSALFKWLTVSNIWVWVNTYRYIFSGMNIHLPAILGFTRYQGFDPSPYTWHFTTSFALEFARNDYVDSRSSRLLMASPFRYSKQLAMVTMVDGDDPSMAGKLSL